MNIIEQIKAEIERLKNKMDDRDPLAPNQQAGYLFALEDVLSFLSTLESGKPMNQDGLEEEINRLWESFADEIEGPHNLFDIYARLARHFAQWGAEHVKNSDEKPIPNDLEEAAIGYSAIGYSPFDDPYEKHQQFECSKFAFIAGAKWQKEQDEKEQADLFTIVALDAAQRAKKEMMKGAVEGEITSVDVGDDSYVKRLKMSELQKAIRNYNVGDKVRVLIIKEYEK